MDIDLQDPGPRGYINKRRIEKFVAFNVSTGARILQIYIKCRALIVLGDCYSPDRGTLYRRRLLQTVLSILFVQLAGRKISTAVGLKFILDLRRVEVFLRALHDNEFKDYSSPI